MGCKNHVLLGGKNGKVMAGAVVNDKQQLAPLLRIIMVQKVHIALKEGHCHPLLFL